MGAFADAWDAEIEALRQDELRAIRRSFTSYYGGETMPESDEDHGPAVTDKELQALKNIAGEFRVVNETTGGEKGRKDERFDLLPSDQLAKVAKLYAFGAKKYADHNWRKGYDWSLSIAALERHLALFKHGEDIDTETQCHHMTSVVFHALTLLWFDEARQDLDDRYHVEENR